MHCHRVTHNIWNLYHSLTSWGCHTQQVSVVQCSPHLNHQYSMWWDEFDEKGVMAHCSLMRKLGLEDLPLFCNKEFRAHQCTYTQQNLYISPQNTVIFSSVHHQWSLCNTKFSFAHSLGCYNYQHSNTDWFSEALSGDPASLEVWGFLCDGSAASRASCEDVLPCDVEIWPSSSDLAGRSSSSLYTALRDMSAC